MRLSHAVLAAVAATLAFVPAAQAKDYAGTALNIIPSGQYGSLPAPPGADEQAQMYAGLTPLYDEVPTDLTQYFKPAALGTKDSCPCRTESVPKKGVTIVRDRFNVPHITATSRDLLTWATGWVLVEDRSLLLQVGRYPARLAAIDAPNTSALALVASVKAVSPSRQTERFVARQTTVLRRTKKGRALLHDVDVYVKGINARLKVDKSAEKPWTRVDVYAVNALVGQIFGQGGGEEATRSELLSALSGRLGPAQGRQVFDDLSEHLDESSPNTTDRRFPWLAVPKTATGNRVLDAGSFTPVTSGNDLAAQSSAAVARYRGPAHMSNFVMVGRDRSTTGHPILVAGPQIGYYYPGLTFEMDLKAPGIEARGASAPGFPGNILIGRGQDNAWTLTSAGSDNIDHYVETLCGSDTRYRFRGRCLRMGSFDAGTVSGKRLRFRTTVHGPVIGYATVGGKRVAVSRKRSTSGQEVLFQLPFRDMTLGSVHSPQQFMKSFAQSPFTFNAGYVDDRDIAFYSGGRLPLRDKRVDPRLPTNGDGRFEWRGWLAAKRHAQAVGAPNGWLANWNNRPAAGWGAADDIWDYGAVHRVQMLEKGLEARQGFDPAQVVAVMNRAATTDLRVEQVWPAIQGVLDVSAPPSPRALRMVELIDRWRASGPGWLDRPGAPNSTGNALATDGKVDSPAAAIIQAAYPKIADAVLGSVLGPQLEDLNRLVGTTAGPSSDFTGGRMGYVVKALQQVVGTPVQSPFKTQFCAGGDRLKCSEALWAAIDQAGAELAAAQGTDVPDDWTIDLPTITFAPVSAFKIPYTNRPSGIQQVLSFTGHR